MFIGQVVRKVIFIYVLMHFYRTTDVLQNFESRDKCIGVILGLRRTF